jgi:aspartate/methionine/tyrosine aminotransferase
VVILDDSYFGLVFENEITTESLFAELSGLHKNLLAIKVDGLTKEEYAWGLRVGFITYGIKGGTKELYQALEEKTAGAVRGNISNSPHLSQSLFINASKADTYLNEKERNKDKIKERYLKVKEILETHKEYREYYEALPFNSGYFMCVKIKKQNVDKVWQTLLDKYSTGVICYSEKNLLRIAFASTPTQKLEKLFNNIYEACRELS